MKAIIYMTFEEFKNLILPKQNHVINIYYNLFRYSRRSVQRIENFFETKIFLEAKIFLYRDNFLNFPNSYNIISVQNGRMKIIQWNYSRLASDSVSETRVQRLLLNFSPIRARRPRCVTQRSLRGKYCFDLYPALFVFVFQSLATQSKEIPQRIH